MGSRFWIELTRRPAKNRISASSAAINHREILAELGAATSASPEGGPLSPVLVVHIVVLTLAVVFAILVYLLARHGLGELLSRTVAIPGGVVFFRRAFLLLLIFGVVGQAVTGSPDVKPGEHFMEYVWAVAGGLGDSLQYIFLTLAIYLVLMTILVATLKPKDDK